MRTFLQTLEALNRKERFFLVGAALGNPTFRLSKTFRKSLAAASIGQTVPSDALVFMDYHLDWIHAAAVVHAGLTANVHGAYLNDPRVSTGNQEDIDLVVAYEAAGRAHLILLEAKAETGWTNKQLDSKALRLKAIFGPDGGQVPGVVPHFSLMSPRPPQQLETAHWPTWMLFEGKPAWMPLHVTPGRIRSERCDDGARASEEGPYFHFVEAKDAL